jgi:hypothetical protein
MFDEFADWAYQQKLDLEVKRGRGCQGKLCLTTSPTGLTSRTQSGSNAGEDGGYQGCEGRLVQRVCRLSLLRFPYPPSLSPQSFYSRMCSASLSLPRSAS